MANNEIVFDRVPQQFYPEWGFRERIPMVPIKMNFLFMNGGENGRLYHVAHTN